MRSFMNFREPAVAVLIALLPALSAPAQEQPAPPATQPAAAPALPIAEIPATEPAADLPHDGVLMPGGKILLNFRNASLDSVLSFLSEAGGLTVINDIKLEGRVNVLNRQPMTIEEALGVLNTLLKDRGYAAVRQGKTLKIIALDSAKKATIPVHTGNNPAEIAETDEVITQVVPVRFADAKQLKTDLAPLIPAYADLSANASTNTLILTDTSAGVRRVVEIIRAIDTTVSTVARIKVFTLKYANATGAARLINDIFKQDQTSTQNAARVNPALARFFGGGRGPAGAAAPADDTAGKPQTKVSASADDRTNTIVVSAPNDVMGVIEQVLKELDANPAQDQAVFTYYLRNAQAVNVQNVINSLFNTASPSGGTTRTTSTTNALTTTRTPGNSSSSTTGSNSGMNLGSFGNSTNLTRGGTTPAVATNTAPPRLSNGATQTAADLAGQVYAVADADTNSVLIMTGSGNFERVKTILAELDRPVPQVLIKVLLAEVTHDNTTDIGVEFSAINLPGSGKTTAFTNFGNVVSTIATGTTPGGFAFQLVEDNVTATITALQRIGKIDVLSRPYILASDNQTASITVGQTFPFITESRLDINSNTINTIQYQDIGIILNVTPHINPDGLVVMDVAPEISSVSAETVNIQPGVNAPVFDKRSAQTRIAIHDGQTIVIGGLMQDKKTQIQDKVPVIGDIPLLGLLFQRNQKSRSKTELLIFLTPHVARVPEHLQDMSNDERKGAVITPNAVAPGVFQEHMEGMQRGADPHPNDIPPAPVPVITTQPAAH